MSWRHTGFAFVSLAGVLLLAGCATGNAGPGVQESGDYPAGYNDGCRTAGSRGAQLPGRSFRDKGLFESSEGYRAGWRAGYGACGGIHDPLNEPMGR